MLLLNGRYIDEESSDVTVIKPVDDKGFYGHLFLEVHNGCSFLCEGNDHKIRYTLKSISPDFPDIYAEATDAQITEVSNHTGFWRSALEGLRDAEIEQRKRKA